MHDDLSEVDGEIYLAALPSLSDWESLHGDPDWQAVVEQSTDGFALFLAGDWSEVVARS